MKQEFIDFVNGLIAAAPDVTMSENVKNYWEAFSKDEIKQKPDLTDNGKLILKHLQGVEIKPYKAKDIAEDLFVSSRTVSGSIRKLVTDGFVDKVGKDPALYVLTEKGRNYNIED